MDLHPYDTARHNTTCHNNIEKLPKKYQVKKKKKFFTKTQENILNFTQISF
jgi:hypothetical protein